MILCYNKIPVNKNYEFKVLLNIDKAKLSKLSNLDVPVLSKELIENLTGEEYKVPLFKDTELELPILKWISSEYPAFGGNDTTSKVGEIGEGQLHETQDREYLSERKTDDMVVKGIHLNQFSINLDLDGPQPRWIKIRANFSGRKRKQKITQHMSELLDGTRLIKHLSQG